MAVPGGEGILRELFEGSRKHNTQVIIIGQQYGRIAGIPPLSPLNIHVALPADTNPPALSVFAPAGRLIRAVTVNAIDFANTDTPLIALVSDPPALSLHPIG